MKKLCLYITLCIASLCYTIAYAQTDTLRLLESVDVVSTRQSLNNIGSKTLDIDSLMMARNPGSNLGEILSIASPVFIKSYGNGALATTSMRGGSASHTSLLWGGIPLNSPTNGQMDLSLIPSSFFDNSSISFGGGSTLWGSGAIGGSIQLSRDHNYHKGLTAESNSQIGSFGQFANQSSLSISSSKYSGFIGLHLSQAKNDFEINNLETGESLGKQINAQFKQTNLYTEHRFKPSKKQEIGIAYWLVNNDRNIPPTLFQSTSQAEQNDISHRAKLSHQYTSKRIILQSRAAYITESIEYKDAKSDLHTKTDFSRIIGQSEAKIRLNEKHALIAGLANTFQSVSGQNFSSQVNQNQFALFASHKFESLTGRLKTSVSMRQAFQDFNRLPAVYSASANYNLTSWLLIRAKASRDYRVPTLNDLYWNPGGNINLKAESGFSEEIGAKFIKNTHRISSSFDVTLFNRNIDNWILWLPTDGYWAPQNILNVWSRGLETQTRFSFKKHDWTLDLNVMSNYVLSTSQKSINSEDESVGLQMMYVPMYSGNAQALISYKSIGLSWQQTYTGYRYTSSDHSQFLNPYWLSSAFLSWKPTNKIMGIVLYGRIHNLLNTEYQQIQNRPMPNRNFQIGLNLRFKSKKHE